MTVDIESRKGMVVYLVPNILTTCSMFLGFYSIILSIQGSFVRAAFSIIFASIFDALDGRVARITGGTSAFGEQYDSLSDAVSFGVAPAILLYMWSLNSFERLGWLACFVYVACGVLRLARFNVQKASVEKNFFQGLPIPIAAGTIVSLVLLFDEHKISPAHNYYIMGLTVLLAALMISNLRFRNFKNVDQNRKKTFLTLVAAVVILVVIVQNPMVNVFVFLSIYIAYGLLGNLFKWKRYKEAIEQLKEVELADQKLEQESTDE